VNLVLLDVLVTDNAGRPVPGLERSNFRVKEMNRVVTVDRVSSGSASISVGLVLDYSRSMIGSQARVVQAAEQLRTRLAPDDEAFVLTFNERVKSAIAPSRIGTELSDRWTKPLYKAVPDGMTALFDAIVQAADTLRSATHERRAMLVLSDGKDTASQATRSQAVQALLETNTLFYGIGLFEKYDLEGDSKTLSSFADHTGGRAIFEPKLDLLAAEFDRILVELRARYVLGFLTSEPEAPKGEMRRVRVFATGSDGRPLRVRTREAFYIASSAK
jgi:Ca-activated chloride channel family protein